MEKAYAAAVEVGGAWGCLARVRVWPGAVLWLAWAQSHAAAEPPSLPPRLATPAPLPPTSSARPQESQALAAKQRQLRADLAAAEMAARALEGQQERIYSLTAELTQARQALTFAQQQHELAASRSGVLEKAHATAVEVSAALCLPRSVFTAGEVPWQPRRLCWHVEST